MIKEKSTKFKKTVLISFLSLISIAAISFLAVHFIKDLILSNDVSYIEQEIEKAKYCEEDSDCVDAGGKCPFDCYVYVNKNEVSRISQLIDSFDSTCTYGCISCPTAKCVNKKCQALCEDGKLY